MVKLNTIKTITHLLITVSILSFLPQTTAAPSFLQKDSKNEFETALDKFLKAYYEEIVLQDTEAEDVNKVETGKRPAEDSDIYDQMQGDQPVNDQEIVLTYNDGRRNLSDDAVKTRDRMRKENWMEYLKSQIMSQLGRTNTTTFTKPPEDPPLNDFNMTQIIPNLLNITGPDDDQITEKIRSFYPSCETPQMQELDQWKNSDDIMTLFFDFDFNTDNKNSNIASATLRLYRLPQNNTNILETPKDDCKSSDGVEEDKLLRVSVYWYTKFQKKRRVKSRLSDSKVVPETSRWVELSVKPATKAWNRAGTRHLGLGILVEDQEGKSMRADKYFKGASCTVGVSTPKPIPTIIRDASPQADELDQIHSLLGRNSTSTVYSDVLLLPTVDICYLEFPDNIDITQFNSARINACNMRKIHEENQRLADRERLERLATLQFPTARHIRHQRQHRQSKLSASDLASIKMEDLSKLKSNEGKTVSAFENILRSGGNTDNKQIIFTREELEAIQRDRKLKR